MEEFQNHVKAYFNISNSELSLLVSCFEKTKLKKGDYFVQRGKECTRLGFLESGMIRVFAQSGDKEVTQWIFTYGAFVTDLAAFMNNTTASWNIQALSDCILYSINSDAYITLNKLIPKWPEIEKQFIVKCFATLENRMFNQIAMTAEERYNYFFDSHKEIFKQVPLQYIASMLGMTPETLSRIRAR